MLAYFARRLVGGSATLLVASFVFYSLVVFCPGGLVDPRESIVRPDRSVGGNPACFMCIDYKLFKLWPANYFAWLFDPEDTMKFDAADDTLLVPKGIDIQIGSARLKGSGMLTGDWGDSYTIDRGRPVLDLMGRNFWVWNVVILSLTSLGMAVALFKHSGHRPRFETSRFPFTPYDRASLSFRYSRIV